MIASSILTSMMRTTAWPASVVLQMLASGTIEKRGAILQEVDVPAAAFIQEMAKRGLQIEFAESSVDEPVRQTLTAEA